MDDHDEYTGEFLDLTPHLTPLGTDYEKTKEVAAAAKKDNLVIEINGLKNQISAIENGLKRIDRNANVADTEIALFASALKKIADAVSDMAQKIEKTEKDKIVEFKNRGIIARLVNNFLGKQQKTAQCHRINITEKTLLIVRLSNDYSDVENKNWIQDFSELINEWVNDERIPVLVLGIHDRSGVEIILEKVEINTND